MSTTPINPVKDSYKVRNWKAYNNSLCKRGSLTLFISSMVLQEWGNLIKKKKAVGEQTYPDSIIQCCLLIKLNYRLKLRQSTGFLSSLFLLLGKADLPIPDYSTLCRRQKHLPIAIEDRLQSGENLVVGIDSTGLKVYGEGEWKVRKHGWSKHRTWSKLHICIDLSTQHILSVALTGNDEDDASVGKRMLKGKTNKINSFHGDGAYDKFEFRQVLGSGIKQIIPPPKNAVIQKSKKGKPLSDHLIQRNQAVEYIQNHGSKKWKIKHGYHKRSLNEVGMFRYKKIFGGELEARKIENQTTEVRMKCFLLNKFTAIGMPDSYKIA
jgi:hypothetical protein